MNLERENQLLKHRVKQLEEELSLLKEQLLQNRQQWREEDWHSPVELRLTNAEDAILGALYKRPGVLTKEQLLEALLGLKSRSSDEAPQIKIVDVFICKIRRKVKPYGINIDTLWGRGYQMDAASRRVLDQWGKLPVNEIASKGE